MIKFNQGIKSLTSPVVIYNHYGIYIGDGQVVYFYVTSDYYSYEYGSWIHIVFFKTFMNLWW